MPQKMCESLDFNIVFNNAVKVWFQKFKAGNFDIENGPRSGRPTVVDYDKSRQKCFNTNYCDRA